MNFYRKPNVVVEIGCNHMGDFELAKETILSAKDQGAEIVKFQKRNNKELLSQEKYNAPHPVPKNSYGNTYGEHREFLEFDIEQHSALKNFCEMNSMVYSTSVWDRTSAKEIASLNPEFIKVPSATNNNFKILEVLRDEYTGGVQISTGMTTASEIDQIVDFFKAKDQEKRLMLYACTSGYPIADSECCLLEINKLQKKYGGIVDTIGYSGHHLGTVIDVAAYTLGAYWIERHYTLDKDWKGTDHSASMNPVELKSLIDNLNSVYEALKYKQDEILEVEKIQRQKLKD